MARRIVILVPHCSDEAAFAGEVLHRYTNRIGRKLHDVTVIFTTDSGGAGAIRTKMPSYPKTVRDFAKKQLETHGVKVIFLSSITDLDGDYLTKGDRIYAALRSGGLISDKTVLYSISSGGGVDNDATFRAAKRLARELGINLHIYWGLNNLGRLNDRVSEGSREAPAPKKASEFKDQLITAYIQFFRHHAPELLPAYLISMRGRHDLISITERL